MGLISNFYAWKYSSDPFGCERTRKWNKDANTAASLQNGVDNSAKAYETEESKKERKRAGSDALRQTAPPQNERNTMRPDKVSSLGSGQWSSVA